MFNSFMLPNNSVRFISNNVKGMKSSKTRLELLRYFKDRVKIGSNAVIFPKESHSDSKVEQKWKKALKVQFFFSHSNSL